MTRRWLIALGGTAVVTFAAQAMRLNTNTVGFVYLIVVLLASLRGSLLLGSAISIVATLSYNYFFFEPRHTFTITDPANWVALATFLLSSVIVSRLVVAARVQTEQKAHMQAIRESDAFKTSLLRAISHDLTTPLTSIMLHTEALRRKSETDDDLQGPVSGIVAETDRLRRRIDNLLSMARLEAGKAKPRREPTPSADIFRAVRENLPLVFAARPVTVHVDDDCADVNVDPSLALEILVNLVENAHRVSPAGAALELLARMHPADAAQVRIEVLDRGPGIPAGIADADGLGLVIARSLAAANGGSVELSPRQGGGTIARLDLPAALLPIRVDQP